MKKFPLNFNILCADIMLEMEVVYYFEIQRPSWKFNGKLKTANFNFWLNLKAVGFDRRLEYLLQKNNLFSKEPWIKQDIMRKFSRLSKRKKRRKDCYYSSRNVASSWEGIPATFVQTNKHSRLACDRLTRDYGISKELLKS